MIGRFTASSHSARSRRRLCRKRRWKRCKVCLDGPAARVGRYDGCCRLNPLHDDKLLDAKVRLHRRLIEEINLSALEKLRRRDAPRTSSSVARNMSWSSDWRSHAQELNDFVQPMIRDEMTGLGRSSRCSRTAASAIS